MRLPLFHGVLGVYTLIILPFCCIVILFVYFSTVYHYYSLKKKELEQIARSVAVYLEPFADHRRVTRRLEDSVIRMANKLDIRLVVTDPAGRLRADSRLQLKPGTKIIDRATVSTIISRGGTDLLSVDNTLESGKYRIYQRLTDGKRTWGIMWLSGSIAPVSEMLTAFHFRFVILSGVLLMMAAAAAWWVARRMAFPLREIGRLAQTVGRGQFNRSFSLPNFREYQELTHKLNAMMERIERDFAELSGRKEENLKIIDSLQAGIMVLTERGRIRLTNHRFDGMSQLGRIENRYYWEVIRDLPLRELIEETRRKKGGITRQLNLFARTFLCSTTFINAKSEIIILWNDITEIKNLERIKKDFVDNVGHELKTPLTAIKGFVETLQEELTGDSKRYADIISRHTKRLIRIVEDLLILSDLERTQFRLELETIDLTELTESTLELFEKPAAEKGLTITFYRPRTEVHLRGDRYRLEQMLINIIDNAIKYTERGGVTVSLIEGDPVCFTVRDTGAGIPQDSLARIYERFYVVDKSRSKAVGGTGLGLSIVKHIVFQHNGTIEVNSQVRRGTEVRVYLPVS